MERDKEVISAGEVAVIRAGDLVGVATPAPREIRATMVAVSGRLLTGKTRAKIVEDAMSGAIREAMAQGITDPVQIRAAMMKARERALAALLKDVTAIVSIVSV